MKVMLYGDGENDPKPELTDSLVESLFASDLPLALLKNMQSFDFEVCFLVFLIFFLLFFSYSFHLLFFSIIHSHPLFSPLSQ